MFTIYRDMRTARQGRMAGGLVDPKLNERHLGITVTPQQVKNQ